MPKPQKTARAVKPSKGLEVWYRQQLDAMVSEMSNSIEYWLEAAYKANPPRIATDALPSAELAKRMRELSKRWIDKFDIMSSKIAERFATSGVKYTDASFNWHDPLSDLAIQVRAQGCRIHGGIQDDADHARCCERDY